MVPKAARRPPSWPQGRPVDGPAGTGQQRVEDGRLIAGTASCGIRGERGTRHRGGAVPGPVGARGDGNVAPCQRLARLDQTAAGAAEPGASLDALEPRRGHRRPAGKHRPGQAPRSRRIWMRIASPLPERGHRHRPTAGVVPISYGSLCGHHAGPARERRRGTWADTEKRRGPDPRACQRPRRSLSGRHCASARTWRPGRRIDEIERDDLDHRCGCERH